MKFWLLITFLSIVLFGFDIKTTKPKQHTFNVTLSGYAVLYPTRIQHIRAFQTGEIINSSLLAGENITKGEILFAIKPYISPEKKLSLQHSINIAKINFKYMKDEFIRIKKLYKYKASYTKEFQKIKTKYLKSKIEYNSALQKLKLLTKIYTYKAPENATILNIKKRNFDFVKSGENILTFSNCHNLYGIAKVFDNNNQLKVGEEIKLVSNSIIYKSKIISILPKLAQNGAKQIIFYINQNKCHLLYGSIYKIIIYIKKFQSIAIPKQAVIKHLKQRYVIIKTNHGFRKQPITIGIIENGFVQIKNGLNKKESIVTDGAYELFNKNIIKKLQVLD